MIIQWGYKEMKGDDILIPYIIKYNNISLVTILCKADKRYGGSSEAWVAAINQTLENFLRKRNGHLNFIGLVWVIDKKNKGGIFHLYLFG